jgi:hypothetical protein
MKAYGARSLITIDDNNIISHNLSLLRGIYRKASISVVSVFDPTKIKTKPYKNLTIIRGSSPKETILKLAESGGQLLFCNHDVVFNDYLIHSIPKNQSALLFDNREVSRNELCGLTQDNKVLRLAFGLDDKNKNVYSFSNIYVFAGQELKLLVEILKDPKYSKFDPFEIVNLIIDKGGEFQVATDKKAKSLIVTSPSEIKVAARIMR